MADPPTLTVDRHELVLAVGEHLGGTPAANLAARALVEAEVLGETAFGLDLLGEDEVPGDAPKVIADGRVGWIDASGTFGPTAVSMAALHAVGSAAASGVGLCVVTGVRRLGRLATYAAWGAENGVVMLVLTDAPSVVLPAGGDQPVLGTNPLAAAVPGTPPFVTDFATSAQTQADQAAAGKSGPLQPRGGLLGTLVGLVVEALTGGISGLVPSRAGRTTTVLAVRPRDLEEAADLFSSLERKFAACGARWPGRRRRAALNSCGDLDIRGESIGALADRVGTRSSPRL